ncbi:glycosyltransferase family 61 protein [Fibrivirga algicola]|uniref:Glycosyltransferase family 61 protein n=1 Tax=Fibrivirga algicola TaxID=2950420 RepID=A0ABX0QIM5_9BACT|nr:glycosyltransferase 61 family protein [Fibrivirga algicola]NID10518.1 glycosyltransferase family 61 protein [Fibrivirga algicola]
MPVLAVFPHRLKDRLKRLSPALLRWVGLKLLSKTQTEELLRPYQVSYVVKQSISLAGVTDIIDPQKVLFQPKVIETEPDFVWNYTNTNSRAELLRSGNLNISNKFLDTDFGNRALLTDLFNPDRRLTERYPVVIALWSHYWGGYYDFLLFVAAKLARIKTVMAPAQFAEAAVSYPLFHTSFETELLQLLDVSPDRLFDTRQYSVHFDRCILANNSSWFYPAADDVLALKGMVEARLQPIQAAPTKRLYISRSGRRRVINEEELVAMLLQYDFEIIEDKPRSVAEQIELYRSASFIVGPHGASFANVLWCKPGTQLLELFAPNYQPEYFRYLAQVLGIRYAAYCFGPIEDSHYTFVDSDIQVSVDEVEKGIVKLLAEQAREHVPDIN